MVEFISPKNYVSVSTVYIENNSMQKVVMTFGQDWEAIYLYSRACGIVVAHLTSKIHFTCVFQYVNDVTMINKIFVR